ncbi:MAG: response regulator transcription factor [Ruminococcaceae bacterium]|nr:response regulator transcription factor [Oscillospiraceae bacterium]
MFNILVAEDDNELRKLFCTVLEKNGYRTFPAVDGEDALMILDREYIDLLICDVMMPNVDGFELTQMLRDSKYNLPVLMITAKGSFADKSQGFASGADDYMVKPIDTGEMLLRVSALLRRAKIVNERKLTVGETVLQYDYLTVNDGEKEIALPQKEFNILYKLLSEPGHIFTRQHLMDEFWGMDSETDARTVDVHINRLREKFGNNKDFQIVTVRGLGYKAVKMK